MYLIVTGSPSAITWLVTAVVVDPLDRHLRRRFTHVLKEGFKAISPAVAHFDAACAVVHEVLAFGVVAAGLNGTPNHVEPRLRPFKRMPVYALAGMAVRSLIPSFGLSTSTTDGMAVVEVANLDDGHRSAIALAQPTRLAAFAHLKKTKNGQATEALTGDIFESGHGGSFPSGCVKGRPRAPTLGRPAYFTIFSGALQ
jgi:hypothetical protein